MFYDNTKTFFFKDQLAVAVGLQLERMKQPVKIIHKGTFKIFFREIEILLILRQIEINLFFYI